ncbi:DinB family protein [Stieleria varia]|uniref:DinB superfamily protein n=1 Tax=Stieleria varia TaxID=2528005 RepID=A0A5C6A080_9BACT|nr:DinB family protein [Stieleria varia]TWT92717.1 DinB superfamily protein [Stieleria varia]
MNTPSPESQPAPTAEQAAQMLTAAIGQIQYARDYTLQLLDETPTETWFDIPSGLPSNIAWQVGHLTVSQYGLLLFRLRGRQDEDLELIPSRFRKAYSRGSTPSSDIDKQLSASELRDRMDRVHAIAMKTLVEISVETLLESEEMPYAVYPNKLGAILFCPLHEQIHAGQIGLIRRALGLAPVR